MEISFTRRSRKMKRITLLPMVNVIFLLLAFFLVTGVYGAGASADVLLPKASAGNNSDEKAVELSIDASGKAYIDGSETAFSLLAGKIAEKISQSGSKRVVIAADARLDASKIIDIMQVIQKASPQIDVDIMAQSAGKI